MSKDFLKPNNWLQHLLFQQVDHLLAAALNYGRLNGWQEYRL